MGYYEERGILGKLVLRLIGGLLAGVIIAALLTFDFMEEVTYSWRAFGWIVAGTAFIVLAVPDRFLDQSGVDSDWAWWKPWWWP